VAAEEEFAMKGGTAINLFYRDLPRLSVDVGLTFLPFRDRARSLAHIDTAMMPIDGDTRRTKRSARSARTGLKRTFES